jgi:hypothetical protein
MAKNAAQHPTGGELFAFIFLVKGRVIYFSENDREI